MINTDQISLGASVFICWYLRWKFPNL